MSNINEIFIEYIDYISEYREFSETTIKNYNSKYKILSRILLHEWITDIEQLDRKKIIWYLQSMKVRYTKSTMKWFITIFRNLLKYCNHIGIGCTNYKAIDYIKQDIRHIEAVPDNIVDIMLNCAEVEKNDIAKQYRKLQYKGHYWYVEWSKWKHKRIISQ